MCILNIAQIKEALECTLLSTRNRHIAQIRDTSQFTCCTCCHGQSVNRLTTKSNQSHPESIQRDVLHKTTEREFPPKYLVFLVQHRLEYPANGNVDGPD